MKALYRVLERGGLAMDPYYDGWTWHEAVKPGPDGSQTTCYIGGFEAIVTGAAMLTADTCSWIDGPLGELHRRAESAQNAAELLPWLRRKRERLVRMLENMRKVHDEGVPLGARPLSPAPGVAARALEQLRAAPSAETLAGLRGALRDVAPPPVMAGFYAPGALGPKGQFMLHLREHGATYEEIATVLDELKPARDYTSDAAHERHRIAVVDALKRRINRQKALLRQTFSTDRVLGDAAQNVPRHRWRAVLFSIRVGKRSTATVHI